MKIVITGAHFTPAQAVIEKLLEIPDIKIVYLGRKYARDGEKTLSQESEVLPKLGIKFIPITAGKMNRFFSIQTIISFLMTPVGFIQAFYYLLKESPDLIVSFGGFTGLPVVICGWLLSIPSIVHEQSLKMGLANLISSFFADKMSLSFKDSKVPKLLNGKKIVITGNPIRQEFLASEINPNSEIKHFVTKNSKPLLLITAGNQGSHKINLLIEDTLEELLKIARVIHQTGDSKFDDFSNLKKNESADYLVKKWIDEKDFNYILEQSDLVVCRAGINTLIELSIKSAPALIVPLPIGSEQKENAYYFSKLGLGEVLEDKKLTPDLFIEKIKEMLKKKESLKNSALNVKKEILLGAESKLVQEILLLENAREGFNFGKS